MSVRAIIILLMLCTCYCAQKSFAQQQGQLSQYMLNYYIVNPAASGSEDFMDFKASYRAQWIGLQNAPSNYYLTFHTPVGKVHANHKSKRSNKENLSHHSIGGMFRGQSTGVLNHTGAYFSYAYHVPVDKNHFMSLGAMLGVMQYSLVGGQDVDPSDPAMNQRYTFTPDGNLGVWFYSKNYFLGLSSAQIFGDLLRLSDNGTNVNYGTGTRINRHYYATGGYALKASDDVKIIPSLLFKYSSRNYQTDINTKIRYRNKVWAGLGYRYKDAIVVLAGVLLKNSISISYSYDYILSGLNKYSSGSHEILVGYKINKNEEVMSPSDFW